MTDLSARNRPLRWRAGATLPRSRLAPDTAEWLFSTGSLTRRVRAACAGRVAVQVVGQAWARPLVDEWRRLRMRRGAVALIREVCLRCDGKPWVFARTVIPRSTLSGQHRRLACLGTRPLGELLFADPAMRREPIEVAALSRGMPLYAQATSLLPAQPREIWGRRTVFHLRDKPLLVSEFFLPESSGRGSDRGGW